MKTRVFRLRECGPFLNSDWWRLAAAFCNSLRLCWTVSDCSLPHNNCLIRRILSVKLVRLDGNRSQTVQESPTDVPYTTASSRCVAAVRATNYWAVLLTYRGRDFARLPPWAYFKGDDGFGPNFFGLLLTPYLLRPNFLGHLVLGVDVSALLALRPLDTKWLLYFSYAWRKDFNRVSK